MDNVYELAGLRSGSTPDDNITELDRRFKAGGYEYAKMEFNAKLTYLLRETGQASHVPAYAENVIDYIAGSSTSRSVREVFDQFGLMIAAMEEVHSDTSKFLGQAHELVSLSILEIDTIEQDKAA